MIYSGKDIGKIIKQARERRNLTQEELAVRVNKKRSYISRIEKGGTNVNIKTLHQIVELGFEGDIKFVLEIK